MTDDVPEVPLQIRQGGTGWCWQCRQPVYLKLAEAIISPRLGHGVLLHPQCLAPFLGGLPRAAEEAHDCPDGRAGARQHSSLPNISTVVYKLC